MGKVARGRLWEPFGLPLRHQSPGVRRIRPGIQRRAHSGSCTQVLTNRALNEIKVGKTAFGLDNENLTAWSNHWQKAERHHDRVATHHVYGLPDYRQPEPSTSPGPGRLQRARRFHLFVRREGASRHADRAASTCVMTSSQINRRQNMGLIDARGGPLPSAAQLRRGSPTRSTWTPGTWRRSPRSCAATRSVSEFPVDQGSQRFALWAQDDWQIVNRLTLNLGVRYDVGIGIFANDITFPPFQDAGRPDDWNNVQPRLGFAYAAERRRRSSVAGRGSTTGTRSPMPGRRLAIPRSPRFRCENDGRADFAANPTNGRPLPTYEDANLCIATTTTMRPDALIRDVQ